MKLTSEIAAHLQVYRYSQYRSAKLKSHVGIISVGCSNKYCMYIVKLPY